MLLDICCAIDKHMHNYIDEGMCFKIMHVSENLTYLYAIIHTCIHTDIHPHMHAHTDA